MYFFVKRHTVQFFVRQIPYFGHGLVDWNHHLRSFVIRFAHVLTFVLANDMIQNTCGLDFQESLEIFQRIILLLVEKAVH